MLHAFRTAAAIALVATLCSVAPALAQAPPSDTEVREALREDSQAAARALNRVGINRLRHRGRFTVRVHPLVAGTFTIRVRGRTFTAAAGRRNCGARGTYRLTLRVTPAGRRYLARTREARLRLHLGFSPARQG